MTLAEIFSIAPFDWASILTALFCGTIIGVERQLKGKPIGIRTSSLILLGTYIFVVAGASVSSDNSDPSRVIGQVVTGVGFLGAGVMLAKDGMVMGVTSAATIWALAAIGVTNAVAGHLQAIKLSFVVLVILFGVDLLENYSTLFTRGVHARFVTWKQKNNGSGSGPAI